LDTLAHLLSISLSVSFIFFVLKDVDDVGGTV